MRAWLYDTLTSDVDIVSELGGLPEALGRVIPRDSRSTILVKKPFLIYGLGNDTNEDLAEANDHFAHRQFFQIWIHDEGGDYGVIDDLILLVKKALVGKKDSASNILLVRWLETSQEFNNQTYNTLFRYVRFQAIIGKGAGL